MAPADSLTVAQFTQNLSRLRKELASTGQDPFTIAALALEQNERLQQRIRTLENKINDQRK